MHRPDPGDGAGHDVRRRHRRPEDAGDAAEVLQQPVDLVEHVPPNS
jgi:hypothetical protein